MTSSKLWIDLTDMASWTGHLTGTQRVVFELGRRYHHSSQDAAFFIYDHKTGAFYQIDFTEIEAQINISRPSPVSKLHEDGPINGRLPIKSQLRALAVRSYMRLPYDVRTKIKPSYKQSAKTVISKLRSQQASRQLRKSSIFSKAISGSKIVFASSDTVILLGKPWDSKNFIESLRLQKQNNNFRLYHLIYDLIPTFLPQVFGKPLPVDYTRYMFEAISLSDKLVAISESTRKDIIEFCNQELLPTPPIEVCRLGEDFIDDSKFAPEVVFKNKIGKTFILCVGTIEARKNHTLLYTTYKLGLREGLKLPRLVIVGGVGWYTGDILYQFANDPELKELVTILNKVDDNHLAWLYKNCLFTVYPSVYEGWGLPVAESLAYGKVCIASNASSIPEVAGNLIDYFSPYDPAQCLSLINKYLSTATLAKKEDDIIKKYESTSWDQTFEQLKAALN